MKYVFTQEDFCDLCEIYLRLDDDLEEEGIMHEPERAKIRQLLEKAEEIE